MKTRFIEASNGLNWGKFMVAAFSADEWMRRSALEPADRYPLLFVRGWRPEHRLVLDLETGEGAIFRPGGSAPHDLDKHRVWVCPLFEPFLAWLYTQDLTDISALPTSVHLPDAEFRMLGHRRAGGVAWRAESPITGEIIFSEDGPTAERLEAEGWGVSIYLAERRPTE